MPAHRVFLVRHAKAEAQAADDDARRLTAEGRARFARLLARLRDRLRVVRVLTSPLARARETADMLAQVTGAPVERDPRLAAGRSSARDVVAMVRKAPPGTALVGHNPELAQALSRNLGAGAGREARRGGRARRGRGRGGAGLARGAGEGLTGARDPFRADAARVRNTGRGAR